MGIGQGWTCFAHNQRKKERYLCRVGCGSNLRLISRRLSMASVRNDK